MNDTISEAEAERRKRLPLLPVKHGKYKTAEYAAWSSMRQRCSNPNHPCFKHYGQRGIRVCERWNSFKAFYQDIGPKPGKKFWIERRNNDLGYSPENCYWARPSQQMRNTRRTLLITYQGATQCLKDWCIALGQNYPLALRRIQKHHWPVDRALTEPAISKFSKFNRRAA